MPQAGVGAAKWFNQQRGIDTGGLWTRSLPTHNKRTAAASPIFW